MPLGYGKTIHELKNKNHINLVFGADTITDCSNHSKSSGTTQKNTSESTVTISANYIRKAIHNKIQQGVYDMYVNLFGADSMKMEENFVDIVFTTDEMTELIEVKPYTNPIQCIREGLGQLLSYYHKHYLKRKNVAFTIIGSKKPNDNDKEFIKFIQTTLNIKFQYRSWEGISKNDIK